ncbi:MAG: ABC transporter permease subunit [Acidimicrobiales bacterium]
MIRLTLRQFRAESVIALGLLTVLGVVLAVTGPHLANVNSAFQNACSNPAVLCTKAPNPVVSTDLSLQGALPFIVTIAPALIGIFFGAPLVARELEAGTFRLAWTQSVTRRRWLAVKLGLIGFASMAVAGLLTWMVDWWASPLDAVNKNRFDPGAFGWHGVAPIGYAAFAFALGVTAGVLLRRTVPATAVTLVGFVAARLAVQHWIRPNLAAPLHESVPLSSSGLGVLSASAATGTVASLAPPQVNVSNGWVLSTAVVDRSSHAMTTQAVVHACPTYGQIANTNVLPSPAEMHSIHDACITKLSEIFHTVVTYQPASRFWPFQWAEMGIFLAAALALCGIAYWWLRRQ